MEKIGASKHILNTNTLELLWTTGKDQFTAPILIVPFIVCFVAQGVKSQIQEKEQCLGEASREPGEPVKGGAEPWDE